MQRITDLNKWLKEQIDQTDYSQAPHQRFTETQAVWEEICTEFQVNIPNSIITIAGTNGKGSCVQVLMELSAQLEIKAGGITSPHFVSLSERLNLNKMVELNRESDEFLADCIQRLGSIPSYQTLGWYQKVVLGVLYGLGQFNLDLWVLEVGLGGRWDAVKVQTPTTAIVVGIADDHLEQLGPTMKHLAMEKAGVATGAINAIYAGQVHKEIFLKAFTANKNLWIRDENFLLKNTGENTVLKFKLAGEVKSFSYASTSVSQESIASAVIAMSCELTLGLAELVSPFIKAHLSELFEDFLPKIKVPGRLQALDIPALKGKVLLDVAHNAQAAKKLADHIINLYPMKNIILLVGLQKKKKSQDFLAELVQVVDDWMFCSIDHQRFISPKVLAKEVKQLGVSEAKIQSLDTDQSLHSIAKDLDTMVSSKPNSMLVVCGSFQVVSKVMQVYQLTKNKIAH